MAAFLLLGEIEETEEKIPRFRRKPRRKEIKRNGVQLKNRKPHVWHFAISLRVFFRVWGGFFSYLKATVNDNGKDND